MSKCPVCSRSELKMKFPHTDFPSEVFVCANCLHGWTDYEDVYSSDTSFRTAKKRADHYAKILLNEMRIQKMMEIGSAADFYFLEQVHKIDPSISLFLNDSFDYSDSVPPHISFLKDIVDAPEDLDLIYMCHVLEHIGDINGFMELVKTKADHLFVEIPCKDDISYFRKGTKTGWHYQFFNQRSFRILMAKHGIEIKRINVGVSQYGSKINVISSLLKLR